MIKLPAKSAMVEQWKQIKKELAGRAREEKRIKNLNQNKPAGLLTVPELITTLKWCEASRPIVEKVKKETKKWEGIMAAGKSPLCLKSGMRLNWLVSRQSLC